MQKDLLPEVQLRCELAWAGPLSFSVPQSTRSVKPWWILDEPQLCERHLELERASGRRVSGLHEQE